MCTRQLVMILISMELWHGRVRNVLCPTQIYARRLHSGAGGGRTASGLQGHLGVDVWGRTRHVADILARWRLGTA